MRLRLGPMPARGSLAQTLVDRIRALIVDGQLTFGETLPSERALAAELGYSRATIAHAYEQLSSLGYLSREHGSGTRVTLPHHPHTPGSSDGSDDIDWTIASLGSAPGLLEATERALSKMAGFRSHSGYLFLGLDSLREEVARMYSELGVPTDPDEVMITSGAMHALALVLAAYAQPRGSVLVEQPTFATALNAIRRTKMRVVPTPVSPDGWDSEHLARVVAKERPQLAYLIPDFHNPTGATMPAKERSQLIASLRAAETTVIVDDTCRDLDIDRNWDVQPMAAFGDVITLGSMAKIAWGGLRIGWIRASRSTISRLLTVRSTIDLGSAVLEQFIAAELLPDLPALRAHASARLERGRAAVFDGLSRMDGVSVPCAPGGLSAWVDLGGDYSSGLSYAARRHGLRLPPGPAFAVGSVLERYIRIPLTSDTEETTVAMERLVTAWKELDTVHDVPKSVPLTNAVV